MVKLLGTTAILLTFCAIAFGQRDAKAPGPQLIAPYGGDVLDNGCIGVKEPVEWRFEWTAVPEASRYHLWVIKSGARLPVINFETIHDSFFNHSADGFIALQHTDSWIWRVRALVHGEWTAWSEIREFDVEKTNSDCVGRRKRTG